MKVVALTIAASRKDILLLDGMHRLRSKVFKNRLSWNVSSINGREYDEFDEFQPTYIVTVDESRILACARLLPATGPTMLEKTFPQLLPAGTLGAHSAMIESSRFCVDTTFRQERGEGALHTITSMMFAGIIEWCLLNGYREIVTATDVRFERLLLRAGWPMRRLGEPKMINETNSVAGLLPADPESFHRVKPSNYHSHLKGLTARTAQENAHEPFTLASAPHPQTAGCAGGEAMHRTR
jgi:N-acyl-L-homoserine lactone synthetase